MGKEHGNFAVVKTSLIICSLSEGFGSNSLNPMGQMLLFISSPLQTCHLCLQSVVWLSVPHGQSSRLYLWPFPLRNALAVNLTSSSGVSSHLCHFRGHTPLPWTQRVCGKK